MTLPISANQSSLRFSQNRTGALQSAKPVGQQAAAASTKGQADPKFGGSSFMAATFGPMALNQFVVDTVGVYAPKVTTVRSKAQLFEETYLELIEDAAFYFTIPAAGYGLGKLLSKLQHKKHPEITTDAIGTSMKGVTENVSRKLLGNKAAALLGAIIIGAGFEYLIQHTKNWATSSLFKINNFTAVAGLEEGRKELKEGENDPVSKAKRRTWQVGALTALGLAGALSLPKLIMKSDALEASLRKIMKYVDFGSSKPFDLTRFGMSLVIASGVASYLDASRDNLERKENALRLAVVVPYLILGKPLATQALTSIIERYKKVGKGAERKTIREHLNSVNLSYRTGANPWKQFKSPGTFMEMGTLQNRDKFAEALQKSALSPEVKKGVLYWNKSLTNRLLSLPLLVSGLIAGIGINLIAYNQTKKRFHHMQDVKQAQALQQKQWEDAFHHLPQNQPV